VHPRHLDSNLDFQRVHSHNHTGKERYHVDVLREAV
jgi:hypothetical protein